MSSTFKRLCTGLIILTFISGCAVGKPGLPRLPGKPPITKPRLPKPIVKNRLPANPTPKPTASTRTVALLSLVDQGKAHLKQSRPDEAIRVLERAVNINPQRGESYYYLSQAWLMKENSSQAMEYNSLAGNYLSNDPQWAGLVKTQRQKIARQ